MTVTAAMVSRVSGARLTLDAEGLAYYLPLALEVLEREDPGLGSATYDRAAALMVCHLAAADKQGDLEMKSENRGGDWSYAKDPGQTSYLVQYRALLEQFAAPADLADEGIVRADATITGLALDEVRLPTFTDLEGA